MSFWKFVTYRYVVKDGKLQTRYLFGLLLEESLDLRGVQTKRNPGFFGTVTVRQVGSGDQTVCRGLLFTEKLEKDIENEIKRINDDELENNNIFRQDNTTVAESAEYVKPITPSGKILKISCGFLSTEELMKISMSISAFHQRYIQISDGDHGNPSAKSPIADIGDEIRRGDKMSEISHGYGSTDYSENAYIISPVNGIVVWKAMSSTDLATGKPMLIEIDLDEDEDLKDEAQYKDYMFSEVFRVGSDNQNADWYLKPIYKIVTLISNALVVASIVIGAILIIKYFL